MKGCLFWATVEWGEEAHTPATSHMRAVSAAGPTARITEWLLPSGV